MQQAHCCISLPEKGEPRRQGTDLWMIWKSGDILVLCGTDMVEPQEIRSKYPPTRNYIKNSDLNCPLVSDSAYPVDHTELFHSSVFLSVSFVA